MRMLSPDEESFMAAANKHVFLWLLGIASVLTILNIAATIYF